MKNASISFIFWFFLLSMLVACQSGGNEPSDQHSEQTAFAVSIEEAHKKSIYLQKKALKGQILVRFNRETRLSAAFRMSTDMSKVWMELQDSTIMVWDGEMAWVYPPEKAAPKVRFDLLTWPYFLVAPFKLTDPGTKWSTTRTRKLNGVPHQTARLSFESGVGDSPDDWYVAYRDPKTNLLAALAYIITYSKSEAEAEADPHCVVYRGYKNLEGVTISTSWTFYGWTEDQGLTEKLGDAQIGLIEFFEPAPDDFAIPEGSAKVPLPGN